MRDGFSNEDLTAYLDEECTPELRSKINAALETGDELRTRLDALELDKDSLRAAFDELAPPSATIHSFSKDAAKRSSTGFPLAKIAAGILLGAFLGAGAMHLSNSTQQPDWTMAVASYQALYTTDTLRFVEQSDDELTSELVRVSATLGKDINLDDLQSFEPLDYRRGQILTFAGEPLVQLAFLTDDGKAVALCITKADGVQDSTLKITSLQGLQSASWSKGEFNYIIIGGDDEALITDAAKLFQERV